MNLQEELEALKERIAELEEQKKIECGFPQNNDKYWYVDDEGSVLSTFYDNHYIDRFHQTIGNFFQTEQQAEFAVEKLKIKTELRKFSKPFEHGGDNYTFNYHHDEGKIVHVHASESYEDLGALYFESKEKAQQAIKAVGGERIKKYIFEVE